MPKKTTVIGIHAFLILVIGCGGGGDATSDPEIASPTKSPATVAPVTPTLSATPAQIVETIPPPTPLATEGDFFLQLVEPIGTEIFTDKESLKVVGRTRVDAVVTINDTVVEPNIDGEFDLEVDLELGPNIIEVVASIANGEQEALLLVAIYLT